MPTYLGMKVYDIAFLSNLKSDEICQKEVTDAEKSLKL